MDSANTKWLPDELFSENKESADGAMPEMKGATQRVYLDTEAVQPEPPAEDYDSIKANIAARSAERRDAAAQEKKRKQRIMLLSVCGAAAAVLILVIVLLVVLMGGSSNDDGLIQNNVFAAGVDLGGMTVEQAKEALRDATDGTYSDLDMTIHILDAAVILSPKDTGASLDVDAVVEAAYNCGRTGSSSESYTVSILPYLNLNKDYIRQVIDDLGVKYSTTLSQTTYSVEGERPSMEQEVYNPDITYQYLNINVGTAEYGLNTETLYDQIIAAYEINLFEVVCECTLVAPEALDYEAIYQELCVEPVNAVMDTTTYEVTPEIYGYGFSIEELQSTVENAEYGSTVTIPMHFIEPDITADFYSDEMFQDTLSTYSTAIPEAEGWKDNLKQVCAFINGTILKVGDEFSFNTAVGPTNDASVFKPVGIYLGKSYQEVTGGGVCQAASTLYYCALMADLNILERNSHSYAVDYIQNGFDAEVFYGSLDLRFQNTTEYPIRIDAAVENGKLVISLIGTDSRDYYVRLNYEIDATYKPQTVYSTLLADNSAGYKNGDVITPGITGYSISTYKMKYSNSNNRLMEETLIAESYYAKRDQVVAKIYAPVVDDPTDPTETTDPSESTDPSETTDPSENTDPSGTTDPTDPSESTGPTDPSETTEGTDPSESTEATEADQNID